MKEDNKMIKWYAYKKYFVNREEKQYDELARSKTDAIDKAKKLWNESDVPVDCGIIRSNIKTGDTKYFNLFH